jgi:L-glyceraldehyde 3-phosphate reductase
MTYLQKLNGIALSRNETLAEMALAWILHQKGITSVLVGASSVAQLENDLKCIQAQPFAENEI